MFAMLKFLIVELGRTLYFKFTRKYVASAAIQLKSFKIKKMWWREDLNPNLTNIIKMVIDTEISKKNKFNFLAIFSVIKRFHMVMEDHDNFTKHKSILYNSL